MNGLLPILPKILQQPPAWVTDFYSKFHVSKARFDAIYAVHPENERRFLTLANWLREKVFPIGCFAGAGISKPYNFPDWKEFLGQSAEKMGLAAEIAPLLEAYRFPEAAQLLEDSNPQAFEQIIRGRFSHRNIVPELRGVGACLPFLSFHYLITTNFDFVLEGIYQMAGMQLKPVFYGANPSFVRAAVTEDLVPLLKIHGEYLQQKVLTSREYEQFYAADAPLAGHLAELFSEMPFLFVGFSLQDEYIRRALAAARDAAERRPIPHFALLHAQTEAEALARDAEFTELGVHPIWYLGPGHGMAETTLGTLAFMAWPNLDLWEVAEALETGDLKFGRNASERMVEARPQCHVSRMAYAYCLAGDVDWDERLLDRDYLLRASSRISEAIGAIGNFAEGYALRAMMYQQMFHLDLAVEDLTKAIELDSSLKPMLLALRGTLRFMFLDGRNEARTDFAQALELLPPEAAEHSLPAWMRFYIAVIDMKNGQDGAVDRLRAVMDEPTFQTPENKSFRTQIKNLLWLARPLYRFSFFRKHIFNQLNFNTRASGFAVWLGQSGIIHYFAKRQLRREARRAEKRRKKESARKA